MNNHRAVGFEIQQTRDKVPWHLGVTRKQLKHRTINTFIKLSLSRYINFVPEIRFSHIYF